MPSDLKFPYEAANLSSTGPAYAVLTAFAAFFLILTVIWYRRVPASSSQTAEWFLTAGRNMKSGIVAASIACTWTWAATLMVSSAEGYQHGIAGPYWYAAGATIPLLLFAVLAIYLKHRAPMAHTFGEFVRHRFGGPSHRLMLCLGLLTCTIVTAMVVLGGAYALRTLTGLDVRLAVLLIPLAFAFYSALGGLRGSIVVEYAQMVILLGIALVLTIWFWSGHGDLGIFDRLRALPAREGETYLTMASLSALLFGIVNTIGNLGTVFMDQTYWQRAIAASAHSAGRSFLIGGLAWFAIPFGVATALGVGGLALGFIVPVPYTDIAPATSAAVFGPLGAWLFLIMLFMAIISTGNAESVAVASLVATDLYKTYLRPHAGDAEILSIARKTTLAFAVLIGPVCLALHALAINMQWLYLTMGIFVGAGAIPLALGLLTGRLTGRGAYWATLGGLVAGLVAWLTAAHQIEGVITVETLGRMRPVTVGNLTVILASALICGIDCARTHAGFRFELLRDAIRSYLAPPIDAAMAGAPPHCSANLSGQERQLIGWAIGLAILLELIVPGELYLSGIQFGRDLFAVWVILSLIWLLMAAGFMILLPIKDHFEIEYPERLGLELSPVESDERTEMRDSIGNRLFLSFLTVVLMLGVGAIVSLVKLGSIEYLRGTNERIITEEALHEDMVALMIPQVLEERGRGELHGLAAAELSERVKLLAASPYTPALLLAMINSPKAQDPIPYLSLGEKERTLIADGIEGVYRGTRVANISRIGQERRQAIVLILGTLISTMMVGLVLTIRTSAAITRPIRRLVEASGHFVAGEPPTPPLPVETENELGTLTAEFNAMAVRIREQVTALKAAEEKFRLIVNHVNDAIIYLDLVGIIRWVNHQAVVISGRSIEEMIGRPFMTVLASEAAARAEARLAAVRRGESVSPLVEFEVNRPDGNVVWVEANITSVREGEKVVGRLLVARDITARKKVETKLVQHARQMEILSRISQQINSVLETPVVMRTLVTSAMDLIEGSAGLYGLVQRGRMVFHEYNDNGQWNRIDLVFEKGYGVPGWVMTTLKPYVCQDAEHDPHVIPDLQKRWNFYNFINVPILNASGELLGCLEILNKRDRNPFSEQDLLLLQGLAASASIALENSQMLVHRKRAEEALRESEARNRSTLEAALDCVISMDHEGRIIEFNPAAQATFGYAREAVIGKQMAGLLIPPSLRERHHQGIAQYLATGKNSVMGRRVELTAMRADGTEFPVELTVTRIGSDARPLFTAFIRDITERKRAEEEHQGLYKRLQASHDGLRRLSRRLMEVQEQERRHLAREMHDEIGQTMTAAKINVQQALRAPTSPEAIVHLTESIRVLDHALQQVRSLALDLRPSLLDDLGLVPTLKWLAKRHSQTSEIAVQVSAEPLDIRPAPETELACYRVAQEALTNAIRHARADQINIELTRSGHELVLLIRDNGIGFDMMTILARATKGESIGLLGMQERVTLAGGGIEISSAPDRGTEVRAWFPLTVAQPVW